MSHPDLAYYQHRAEQEIELAQRAGHVRAVQAHYQLASAYLDRVYGTGERVDAQVGAG
ncbi:MAG TPA: hypothetical protein VGW34_12930 [Allosphingosinicella sp.]|nr:hypothetical protein [Allosphingosinicella sp.]